MSPPDRALEVNAAGLVVAARGAEGGVRVAAPVPGFVHYEGEPLTTGEAALRRARLAPLWTCSRHFEELSTEPLVRPRPLARSHADLVYAQLAALAGAHGAHAAARDPEAAPDSDAARDPATGPAARWLLAVPGAYSVAQLQLLLGISRAAGLAIAGFVDAAVAACADHAGAPRAFHLDIEMHRATLTELARGETLRRGRVTTTRAAGLRAYHEAFGQLLAQLFVRATRFDPTLQATTEQKLHDALPGWLEAAAAGEVAVALEHGGLRHETRLAGVQLHRAAAPLHAELLRLVHSARRAGEAVTLYVTDRVAELPGIDAEFAALRDCEVVRLPPGSAAAGALAHAAEIAGDGELALANRLTCAAPIAPERRPEGAAQGESPTHLVHQGRAYALGPEPLVIGRGSGGARRLAVDAAGAATAGVSRSHCSLVARGGEVVLEDHSTWGTWINGERVQRRARLRAGDRIRVGAPGAELELVRLAG